MILLLSPSKGQDFTAHEYAEHSQPAMLRDAKILVKELKTFGPQQIAQLMSVSESLAELNHGRFQRFKTPLRLGVAKQAALAFKGDVYNGLDADSMGADEWQYAQNHLRILSGLYGYLRPQDLILPYRLEMKTRLANERGDNLYQFWGDKITQKINQEVKSGDVVVNLASNEYFKAVQPKALKGEVLTIDFKDTKAGKTRSISFFAKQARGMMARAIINHQIKEVDQIKSLEVDGYRYHEGLSTPKKWIFERQQPPPKNG
ncbi:peroxide stress protein YaaA [Marinicella meishanensis]|uniref:peroxide stress protein YaaA n=1 Tax=Marinicella meishanensis TaxID=2873263 RepID=UPI001CBFF1FD|nr:peroxide stress protein YaaA [Marinicella sp. NBU2979]